MGPRVLSKLSILTNTVTIQPIISLPLFPWSMRRLNNAAPAALESRSREEPLKAGIALLIMILFSSAHGSLKSVAAVFSLASKVPALRTLTIEVTAPANNIRYLLLSYREVDDTNSWVGTSYEVKGSPKQGLAHDSAMTMWFVWQGTDFSNSISVFLYGSPWEPVNQCGDYWYVSVPANNVSWRLSNVVFSALPRDEASEKVVRSKRKVMEFLPSLWIC